MKSITIGQLSSYIYLLFTDSNFRAGSTEPLNSWQKKKQLLGLPSTKIRRMGGILSTYVKSCIYCTLARGSELAILGGFMKVMLKISILPHKSFPMII